MHFNIRLRSALGLFGFLLIFLAFVFPRNYGDAKLAILLISIMIIISGILSGKLKIKTRNVIGFFSVYIFLNAVAAINGYLQGNDIIAVLDGVRLGVLFPPIIGLLWLAMFSFEYEKYFHRVVIAAGVAISFLVIGTVVGGFIGVNFFSEEFTKDNLLIVGIHEGYTQVIAHNIGSLFFVVGYILYFLVSSEGWVGRKKLLILVASVILIAVLMSGRRALVFLTILSPLLLLLNWYLFVDNRSTMKNIFVIAVFFTAVFTAFTGYFFVNNYFDFDAFIDRGAGVLSDDGGARVSQAGLLFNAFTQQPILGSGFGGTIDLIRSEERPWIFELTYLQLLFNFGAIGFIGMVYIFSTQYRKIHRKAKNKFAFSSVEKSMACGFTFLLIGAISNPYFGSFDFLLTIGVLPFLASKN